MKKNILTCSDVMKHEYCASVIRVGELHPLEGADKLEKTLVNGNSFVVEKGVFKEGEICFYCENETELNADFLSINNQFDIDNRDKNSNYVEVEEALKSTSELKEDVKSSEKTVSKLKKLQKRVSERNKLAEKIKNIKTWLDEHEEEFNSLKEKETLTAEETDFVDDYKKSITALGKKENSLKNYDDIATYSASKVQELIDSANATLSEKRDKYQEAVRPIKTMVGYFNKYGRVRAIRLRGCPSYGYLFNIESMKKYCPEIADVNLDELVGTDFDTVNGELFCKAYVPRIKETPQREHSKKRNKKLKKFNMLIPGEFSFHYDTEKLQKNIQNISKNDVVFISTKCHGTSGIFSNVKVRYPKEFHTPWKFANKLLQKIYLNIVPEKYQSIRIDYGNIYSSRTVIKNSTFNPDVNSGYYKEDIWGIVNDMIKDYIEPGMSIYGEIVGYLPSGSAIQKSYDYGCDECCWKLMPYRITTEHEDGRKYEWAVSDVANWTIALKENHPEIADKLMVIDVLYHGTLSNLYPNLNPENHWHEDVLEALKIEQKFGMEMDEPLCKNKVPREGIVLRLDIDGYDPRALEAYKLKTDAFFEKEREDIDAGYVDIEMSDAYGDIEMKDSYDSSEN